LKGEKMDKHPIRRKFVDNPYTLSSNKNDNVYIISFIDSNGTLQNVIVNKEVYDLFDENEKYENARIYEYSKRLLHNDINPEKIPSSYSLEGEVINNMTIKELKNILSTLPSIQKRRIIKYYFEDKTLEQIAQEENCSKMAIKFSIDIALEKILKKFQK